MKINYFSKKRTNTGAIILSKSGFELLSQVSVIFLNIIKLPYYYRIIIKTTTNGIKNDDHLFHINVNIPAFSLHYYSNTYDVCLFE